MSVLCHASQNKELAVIEPKHTLSKNRYIGDYVFATSDRLLAIMYLSTRGYATLMDSCGKHPNIVICADSTEYLGHDKGGAIYELPSDTFIESPQKELGDREKVSKVPVKPLRKTTYNKSIDAMLEAGIKVRFVESETFNNLIKSPDQAGLIEKLPAFTK